MKVIVEFDIVPRSRKGTACVEAIQDAQDRLVIEQLCDLAVFVSTSMEVKR